MNRKILVIRGGAIGDFILTLPVFAALRKGFPGARLETIACPRIAAIAEAAGLVDAIRPIESRGLAGFFASEGTLDPVWAAYFSSFDLIISYLFDPQGYFQHNLARCTSARLVAGPHRPAEPSLLHATRQLLEPLESICAVDLDSLPSLRSPGRSKPSHAPAHLMIHPGSGSPAKNWPDENWCALLTQLAVETNWLFTIFAGEAEGWRADRLHSLLPASRAVLARNWPLPEIAQNLKQASLFIGHDSGITHLAAACAIPVLALWGSTNITVWAPSGPQVTLLREPGGLGRLSVESVAETAKTLVAESPAPITLPAG